MIFYTIPFHQESNLEKPNPRSVGPSSHKKSKFLQKLSCQKLCGDQVTLSILVY